MRVSSANAEWNGTLKEGHGAFSTGSGAIAQAPYSFATRFGDANGTNPEEMIAAAHAACFSMALGAELEKAGHPATSLRTTAKVTVDMKEAGPTVTSSRLEVVGAVPGASESQFMEAANAAKAGCPISRLLNTEITLDARLEG